MEIIGSVKNYEWGKLGLQSEVASLMKASAPSFTIENNVPYAELWLGDHPSGPSKIRATGIELGTFIDKNRNRFIGGHESLPFLLKVLSIKKALSIQVHPDKAEAENLHKLHPDLYKDQNHKPELAIALTSFRALCGFRPYKEILEFCKKFKPMEDLLGRDNVEKLNSPEGLKVCYDNLMNSAQKEIDACIDSIKQNHIADLETSSLLQTFTTINNDFPNDVGVLSLFFLNILNLNPGQAIFLPANEPHAYLEGDVIECMACSDNVIRAGLTPKYKDVPTLLRLLNYKGQTADEKIFQAIKKDSYLDQFIPGIKDFAVMKLSLPQDLECYKWENRKFGCILLVLHGKRKLHTDKYGDLLLARGSSVFIPADCQDVHFILDDCTTDFVGYIAMYNDF